eukprot:1719812-Amphidinium_carterae.1
MTKAVLHFALKMVPLKELFLPLVSLDMRVQERQRVLVDYVMCLSEHGDRTHASMPRQLAWCRYTMACFHADRCRYTLLPHRLAKAHMLNPGKITTCLFQYLHEENKNTGF